MPTNRERCRCHLCRPEPSYDERDQRLLATVQEHGWQVLLVGGDDAACDCRSDDCGPDLDGRRPAPPFAYTVGLGHHCDHPEILASGLPPDLLHSVVQHVAERVAAGRHLREGDVLEGVLGHVPVVVHTVSDTGLRETVTWSGWFHRGRPEAYALVWPTTAGVFAWQPGAPAALDALQPPSLRVPHEHTGGVAADPTWVMPVPADERVFSCAHVVDGGDSVLWVARERDAERGEDWTFHCGAVGHADDDIRLVHLAHLMRGAPSLRELADLRLQHQAERTDVDAPWQRSRLT